MPALNLGQFSLSDPANPLDITIFDVDPESYNPFNLPLRGSSFETLDGGVIHQDFGTHSADIVIEVSGEISQDTMRALHTRYINRSKIWRLQDWFGCQWNVIFKPGAVAYHPVPIRGSCEFFTYTLTLQVTQIIQWFGGAYA